MNNSPAMPQELSSQLACPCGSAGCLTSRPYGARGERPVRLGTRWRRSRARNSLQRQVTELAAHASRPDATLWRAQPVIEVCAATHYPAWRKARDRAWKRDGNTYSVHSWPERIAEGELAAVLLMQSHGGHRRGQPAELAAPGFAHGFPARGHDVEHPYEPLALALLVSPIKLALADERHAALLAPPLTT
jgi:hypothetical protein